MIQFSLDADGRFTLLEGRGLDALRLRPGELVGRSIFEVAREFPELTGAYLKVLRGLAFSGVSTLGRSAFDVHWAPLLREDGSIRGVTGAGCDVAAVARVALAVARNELRHRATVETDFGEVSPVAIPERQLGQILVNPRR